MEWNAIGKSVLRHLVVFFVLTVVVFVAYSNSLKGDIFLDDVLIKQKVTTDKISNYLRPGPRHFGMLTFFINGEFNVVNYRIVNIIIHIFNAFLVYAITYITLQSPLLRDRLSEHAYTAAIASGLIFALHPININAVAYISQRVAALAAFFTLMALIFYIFAHKIESKYKSCLLYGLCLVSILLGVFSKENAIIAIPLIILYDFFFITETSWHSRSKKMGVIVLALAVTIVFASFYLNITAIFSQLVSDFLHSHKIANTQSWHGVDISITAYQHILTQFRVICRYLSIFVVPLPSFLAFDRWGYPVSNGLFEPLSTLLSIVAVLSLLLIAVLKARRLPFLSFGILWYFIAISLESFVAVGLDLYFEHRNYLPSTGLIMGLTIQAFEAMNSRGSDKRMLIVIACVVLILGLFTYQRNYVWKDAVTLWLDTTQKAPYNTRAVLFLGNAYLAVKDYDNAAVYYERGLKMSEQYGSSSFYYETTIYSLAMAYFYSYRYDRLMTMVDYLEERLPDSQYLPVLKGAYAVASRQPELAMGYLEEALKGNPELVDKEVIYLLIGDSYRHQGLFEEAIKAYQKALAQNPKSYAAYYAIGKCYLALDDLQKALEYMQMALLYDNGHIDALSDAADILLSLGGDISLAQSYVDRAVSFNPSTYKPYMVMGNVKLYMGNAIEAEKYYEKALGFGAAKYAIAINKGRVYNMLGRTKEAKTYFNEALNHQDTPTKIKRLIELKLKEPD